MGIGQWGGRDQSRMCIGRKRLSNVFIDCPVQFTKRPNGLITHFRKSQAARPWLAQQLPTGHQFAHELVGAGPVYTDAGGYFTIGWAFSPPLDVAAHEREHEEPATYHPRREPRRRVDTLHL